MIILAPAWFVSLCPNLLIYILPNIFINRLKDKMFEGTIRYTMSVMLTIPLFYTLTFVLSLWLANIWVAIIYTCMLPALGIYAWNYWQFAKRTCRMVRFHRLKADKRQQISNLRSEIISELDRLTEIEN
jgi:phosphatidylserine synthase